MSPMRDGRTDGRQTREDRATHPMEAGWLSFANLALLAEKNAGKMSACSVAQSSAKRPNLLVARAPAVSSVKREAECNRVLPGCARWLSVA